MRVLVTVLRRRFSSRQWVPLIHGKCWRVSMILFFHVNVKLIWSKSSGIVYFFLRPHTKKRSGHETNRRKRFYKKASVYCEGEGYGVSLDHRSLHTPLRKLFIVPHEELAVGVAQEWSRQNDVILPSFMHLTSLCNTVIDEIHREGVGLDSLQKRYLDNDTLCYYTDEPEELVKLQLSQWGPVIDWFNNRFSTDVHPTNSLVHTSFHRVTNDLFPAVNKWTRVGLQQLADLTGSFILTMALWQGRLSVSQTCQLTRLETRYQINHWGQVEAQHRVDEAHLTAALSATLFFIKCN
ncbi:ATP synthase mitochondrial F1 complex assembly factor 2-like isoform X2 [Dysidea avara]|uniref:ATP synthase mitochondrial F1 complex assembly factor 2-like isoform X2 n=1 Tax=Dysidea avara TaxID=196820 RepID=UPI00331C47CC